jgi:hypothetical protein
MLTLNAAALPPGAHLQRRRTRIATRTDQTTETTPLSLRVMGDFELPRELRQSFAERADRWDDLLRRYQQLLGQQISDHAREWMGDQLMTWALFADADRAWARGDIEAGNQLMEIAKPYMERARHGFHVTVRGPDPKQLTASCGTRVVRDDQQKRFPGKICLSGNLACPGPV